MALPESDKKEYNPGELHRQEQFSDPYTRAGIDQAEAFANDRTKASEQDASKNIDNVKKQENDSPLNSWKDQFTGQGKFGGRKSEQGRPWSKANVNAVLKKKGPLGLLLTILVVGSVGLGSASLPALLLIHVKEMFTQSLDTSNPALTRATNSLMAKKIGNINNTFSETSDGKCGVKCRMNTMDDTMKRNFEAKGFTIEGEQKSIGGKFVRWSVHSITLPVDQANPKAERTVIKNGNDWKLLMKDPIKASLINKVFNSRTAYFMNSKFGETLRARGLDKLSKLAGNTKEKVIESMRKMLGLEGTSAATDPTVKITDPAEKLASGPLKGVPAATVGAKAKLAGKGNNIVSGACVMYDVSKGISYATKVGKMAQFLPLAMMTLNLADKIKAGNPKDNATPEEVSQVAGMWTQQDTNKTTADGKPNPDYGKTATDSAAYQMSTSLDNPAVNSQDLMYGAGLTTGVGAALAELTAFVVQGGVVAITATRTTCQIANSPVVGVLAQCPGEVMAALATGVETLGIGAIVSAVECAVRAAVTMAAMGGILNAVIEKVIPMIAASELPNLSENMRGSPVSTATRTATASILGDGKALSNGLKTATSSDEVKNYALAMASQQRDDIALARYEAKSTPFDIYNQYSFLGSLAGNLQLSQYANSSVATILGGITSILPSSFASLVSNSYALSDATNATKMANLYTATSCPDAALRAVGVVGDGLCTTTQVISEAELNANTDQLDTTLISDKQIDEYSGNAIPGSDYEKYLTNCANRPPTEPIGETSASIEDNDYEWKVGLKCSENSTELSNFRSYRLYNNVENTIGKTETLDNTITSSNSTTTTAVSNTLNGNGSAIKGDDYPYGKGPIDINSPLGYATRECVDFVAWRLNEQSGITGQPFSANFKGFGNAVTWKERAVALGQPVDQIPTLGSVAWWGDGVWAGGTGAGPMGHVAIVSAKNADGSIQVEQYNVSIPGIANYHEYSTLKIPASDISHLYFLHLADIKGATST